MNGAPVNDGALYVDSNAPIEGAWFEAWLRGVFDERLRTCLADMRAAGISADECAEAAVVLTEESERARLDVLRQVGRIMSAPDAPSHSAN